MSELDRSQPPAPGAVKAFGLPRVERDRLPNGLGILSARHGQLPLVTAALVLEAGAEGEPPSKAGLAHLVANALEAGSATRSADEVAWELESLGVEFHADARWDGVVLSIVVPAERLDPAMALFADLVRNPAFREEEVERLREEQLAEILQRRKEPRALANDMAAHFIFGDEVPYRRPLIGTSHTVRSIGRADIEEYYRTRYAPAGASLLLVGDVAAAEARRLADRYFGDWRGDRPPAAEFPVTRAVESATVFIVDRPGSVQSEIRIGDVGVARHHEDYFPLLVMNSLLGGAFTSRLNLSLRERHGFTYGVRSGFAFRRRPGPFVIQTAVATEVTARAVEEALKEIHLLRDEGPSAEEVAAARDYLAGILPLELQTTEQVGARLADLVIYDLPDDYFETYRQRILGVTAEEVHRVARDHLRPERLAIVVVGAASEIAPALEALGIGPVRVERVE
ncbi:MAG TPA: pitrilysin family protein [Longimicrobiales bacterium]|nr:pitrilysin family protein [Longimicrobiales bacterium]